MNRRKLRLGDPYGNRTRASAVKGGKARLSTAFPIFDGQKGLSGINGLAGRGESWHLSSPSPQRGFAGAGE